MASPMIKPPHGLPSPQPSPRTLSPVEEDGAGSANPSTAKSGSATGFEMHSSILPASPLAFGYDNTRKPPHTHQRNRSSSLPTRDLSLTLTPSIASQRRLSGLAPVDVNRVSRPEITKMSPSQILDLTSAPESLPVRSLTPEADDSMSLNDRIDPFAQSKHRQREWPTRGAPQAEERGASFKSPSAASEREGGPSRKSSQTTRPQKLSRSMSIPVETRGKNHISEAESEPRASPHPTANARRRVTSARNQHRDRVPSSRNDHLHDTLSQNIPAAVPLPPFSLPTYLQLELSSQRPSPLYIYQPSATDYPYESSKIKLERLQNFLLVPPYLENILLFGALTCLDSWLYTFTVLPLRFFKSLWMLLQWMLRSTLREVQDLGRYVFRGLPRLWRRRGRTSSVAASPALTPSIQDRQARRVGALLDPLAAQDSRLLPARFMDRVRNHRRSRSVPSTLQRNHKADILSGLLVIFGCVVLSQFDASRMYHNIRGQAAIKLYVIYNVLEVCDRLFSALGQDIMECLFSNETLDRKPNGRSKVFQPLWMFALALAYTVIHATALFYQVITLNVAVNSYSNALLTLLMSNQFVEIKGSVFKKFEKENLFQLTCADIVERFQLWLMLLIIALRNIVEVGGLSITGSNSIFSGPSASSPPPTPNATNPVSSTFGILPNAFTTLPSLFPFQVLSPFLVVLGSEMLVDWLKHAYITKFNATSPRIYTRFLDILSKDYYTHAFADQSLMKRIGLPVIPLACLFIRATLQTYHMFLATNISPPSISTATSLTSAHTEAEPTSSPILAQLDLIFRRALGHSSLGGGAKSNGAFNWTIDDGIALATMLLFFLALYLLLLALKLALGMVLLSFARGRYACMLEREIKGENERLIETDSKRLGGWGVTELGEERRKAIYEGHEAELWKLKEKEGKFREKEERESLSGKGLKAIESVERYAMVAKRIW